MTVKQIAIKYIKTLSVNDREKLKKMLKNNIVCGHDYAIMNNLDPVQLNDELKLILGVN